jgi:hypothetical protein
MTMTAEVAQDDDPPPPSPTRNDALWLGVGAVVLLTLIVVIAMAVRGSGGNPDSPLGRAQDRGAQSDLRNALTVEKTYYTDNQAYTDSPASLHEIETDLDWGGRLHVVVGQVNDQGRQTVCMDERSASGRTFSIADVAMGPNAGTYFGEAACASTAPSALAALGSSWDIHTSVTWVSGGNLEPTDQMEKCATEGQTFETAVQAYRAQNNVDPAGTDVQTITRTLIAGGLVVGPQTYAGSGRGTWSYNVLTQQVDTSQC